MDGWRRLRRGMLCVIVGVALGFSGACVGSSTPDPTGTGATPTTAETWFAHYRDAQRQETQTERGEIARHHTPHSRPGSGFRGRGRKPGRYAGLGARRPGRGYSRR